MRVRTSRLGLVGTATHTPERALVLNVTFQPISVVSQRRAMVLVLSGKAESVHKTEHLMHSERLAIALPSVVRLKYLVKVPYRRHAPLHRRALFTRDGHRCQYCGGAAEGIDHVLPRSRGGDHLWENVVACCRPCNVRKGDRLLSEVAGMKLLRRPSVPGAMSWVAVTVATIPLDWRQYLPQIVENT